MPNIKNALVTAEHFNENFVQIPKKNPNTPHQINKRQLKHKDNTATV